MLCLITLVLDNRKQTLRQYKLEMYLILKALSVCVCACVYARMSAHAHTHAHTHSKKNPNGTKQHQLMSTYTTVNG